MSSFISIMPYSTICNKIRLECPFLATFEIDQPMAQPDDKA